MPEPRAATVTFAQAQSLCVLYILLWCLFPPLAIDAIWRIALFAAFALWFALEGLRSGFARLANWPAALTLFFLGYITVVQLLTGGPGDVLHGIQLDILLVCALIGIAYRGARLRELEWLVLPVLAVLVASIAMTLAALARDPHAARLVVRTSEEALALLRAGVGGYQLVYACAILAPLLLLLTLKGWRFGGAFALALAATLAAAAALVVEAGYSIAFFTVAAGTLLALVATQDGRTGLLQSVLVVTAILLALLLLDPLLSYAETLASGTKYARKLADLRLSFALGESVGTASDRMTRYLRSLTLFSQSPLFGVLSYDSIGKHSQILDTFARYGGPVGVLGVFVLVRLPARLLPPLPRNTAHAPLVMMTTIGIVLTLNNATAAHGAIAYLLAPMVSFAYGRRAFARHGARLPPASAFAARYRRTPWRVPPYMPPPPMR